MYAPKINYAEDFANLTETTSTACPDCARLKALLADVWKFAKPNSFDDPMDKFEEYRKLGARIKREGIG